MYLTWPQVTGAGGYRVQRSRFTDFGEANLEPDIEDGSLPYFGDSTAIIEEFYGGVYWYRYCVLNDDGDQVSQFSHWTHVDIASYEPEDDAGTPG